MARAAAHPARHRDTLLSIGVPSDVYVRMVADRGRAGLHRHHPIEGGTHVDSLYDAFPDKLRPILPCCRAAFTATTVRVERRKEPPAGRTVPRPASGDLVNTCSLDRSGTGPGPAPQRCGPTARRAVRWSASPLRLRRPRT
ncbi:hypothetical protein [Streptomyces sp. NPDC002265]|uniref:hypothetical protein n=1 Tax=Streptomyces sp. NPDC002265 TaxID=3154415 RepID=UPI0033198AE1